MIEEETWLANNFVEDPKSPYGNPESRVDFIKKLQLRTKRAAIEVINLIEKTPSSQGLKVVSYQIIKSATSSAANYRAACRARSQREFYAKICIVVEETDETVFWLEVLYESEIQIEQEAIVSLGKEWRELLKIMATSKKNSKPDK